MKSGAWMLAMVFSLAAFHADAADPKSAPQAAPKSAAARPRKRRAPRYKDLARPRGPRAPLQRLASPGWRPEVKQALESLLTAKGNKAKTYDIDWPPVAVFILDGVAHAHDSGEVAFLRLVERAEFRFAEPWWQRVPLEERARARRAHKLFSSRPEAVWPQDEDFLMWRKAMLSGYDLICRRDGRRACRSWLTSLLMGYTEGEAESYMRETVEEALRDPFSTDRIGAHAGDEKPVPMPRGLRRTPAMQELVRELLDLGFDVWALSASNQWVAEAMATRYGIDPSRVIGMRSRVLNRRLQPDVVDPLPVGAGTTEAVILFVGRHPDLVVAPPEDVELLEHGKGLRVAIDRGDERFAARAKERGWLLQPELPHAEAETGSE